MDKIAVLLLNLGGPDSLKAIRPFLVNLFSDRRIIKLPLQPLLAWVIANKRSKKVMPRYEAIGGSSPLNKLTFAQAKSLERKLNEINKGKFKTFVGMRYWHPYIDETMAEILHSKENFSKLIALPLFPQYSCTTTGSCFNQVKAYIKGEKKWHFKKVKAIYINNWHDNELYVSALVKKINEGLDLLLNNTKDEVHVVFSAHSIPQQFVDKGDPYKIQIEETVASVLRSLDIKHYTIAYQSRSGPVKWLEPDTKNMLEELAQKGQKAIMVVPISFVSDHIETLYEIDIMYAEMCRSLGVEKFVRSPSLNSDPLFIDALADIVLNYV